MNTTQQTGLFTATVLFVIGLLLNTAYATSPAQALGEQEFVNKVISSGLIEVELGELAQKKSSSKEVQAFGESMVTDHGKTNEELEEIAEEKNLVVPSELTAENQEVLKKMTALEGKAFDQAYAKHMEESHQKAVQFFKAQSLGMGDTELRQFASSTLPTLEHHLKMAEELTQEFADEAARGQLKDR